MSSQGATGNICPVIGSLTPAPTRERRRGDEPVSDIHHQVPKQTLRLCRKPPRTIDQEEPHGKYWVDTIRFCTPHDHLIDFLGWADEFAEWLRKYPAVSDLSMTEW